MDIPNLANTPTPTPIKTQFSAVGILVVTILAIASGFTLSRLTAQEAGSNNTLFPSNSTPQSEVSSSADIKVGQTYGNTNKSFKDTATGTVEKGSINGEGTHILNREGGPSQRASLISSSLDLDLFVGHKVEVKGETNASNKTSWLLDVGLIKVLE